MAPDAAILIHLLASLDRHKHVSLDRIDMRLWDVEFKNNYDFMAIVPPRKSYFYEGSINHMEFPFWTSH